MDTKFRKLISRLSIKEKKLEKVPYPRMISASPLALPVDSLEVGDVSSGRKLDNVGQDLTSQQQGNILTSVRFPCPTLLRKTKSMCEGVYEEVKPNHFVGHLSLLMGDDESQASPRHSVSSSGSDENNNLIGQASQRSSGSSGDGGGDYMNLQEVERERRRLMAAQRVRAKYAESWIDGQVVDDSILGDNKEKTKLYWESLMRHDQMEREREKLNQLNNKHRGVQRTSSNTSPVIQKINAEIQELHKREKELMSRSKGSTAPLTSNGSQAEEEDDVFSSNGSSVDEFEHSESPRLESGFYSNLGEDEAQLLTLQEVLKHVDPEVETTESRTQPLEAAKLNTTANLEHVESEKIPHILDLTLSTSVESVKRGQVESTFSPSPVPVEVTRISGQIDIDNSKILKFQKETPIEKEIRLARERDEEYRQRRLSSMTEPTTPKITVVATELKKASEPSPAGVSVKAKTSELEDKRFGSAAKGSVVRNIQYQMATERLRKEMLEAQRREDELQKIHRTVSMSTLVTDETEAPRLEIKKIDLSDPAVPITQVPETLNNAALESKPEPKRESEVKLSQTKTIENEPRLPNTLPPITTSDNVPATTTAQLRSPTFAKSGFNSFNSIQRYLLKSSVQLRIAKNFQLPPPPPEKVVEKSEPIVEEVEEAPRRKLVPATHKIQNELREMKEREKELALIRTRSFKSTPNLLADLTANGISIDDEQLNTPAEVSFQPTKERKRSNLINQWEMIIQSGN